MFVIKSSDTKRGEGSTYNSSDAGVEKMYKEDQDHKAVNGRESNSNCPDDLHQRRDARDQAHIPAR